MAYKVVISESADRDLDEILTYMVEKLSAAKAAADFADELDQRYSALERQPLMYELSRDNRLRKKGYRRFPVKNYIVFYTVDETTETVNVSRIFYGRRDYESIL